MKFLATRVCQYPIFFQSKILTSFDSELWKNSNNLTKIQELFLNSYNSEDITTDDEYFQPKFTNSLNYYNNFIPCVLGVKNNDYNNWMNGNYKPNSNIYKKCNLVFLGYEVIDTLFISCISHGISPISDNKLYLLNDFCLFGSKEIADSYLKINQIEIPEHQWRLVGLFVDRSTYDFLKTLKPNHHRFSLTSD